MDNLLNETLYKRNMANKNVLLKITEIIPLDDEFIRKIEMIKPIRSKKIIEKIKEHELCSHPEMDIMIDNLWEKLKEFMSELADGIQRGDEAIALLQNQVEIKDRIIEELRSQQQGTPEPKKIERVSISNYKDPLSLALGLLEENYKKRILKKKEPDRRVASVSYTITMKKYGKNMSNEEKVELKRRVDERYDELIKGGV